jgi:hypothetical protein
MLPVFDVPLPAVVVVVVVAPVPVLPVDVGVVVVVVVVVVAPVPVLPVLPVEPVLPVTWFPFGPPEWWCTTAAAGLPAGGAAPERAVTLTSGTETPTRTARPAAAA